MPDAPVAPRLTSFSHGAGCGCKLSPGVLAQVVGTLAPAGHPDLLVGADTADDAAVWRLSDDRALVVTTDFFTPVVDDARTWGRIAAANAVSDVYAMGGTPMLALNIVAWNVDALGLDLLGEVLEGGASIAAEAGFVVAGGHSIDDPEPKYGMAVIGEVHPDRALTNAGLRAGDVLVLTKPLGVGIATTAVKRGVATAELTDAAVGSMTRLNDHARDAAVAAGATGCTDVTGFGLLGHLRRMATESGVAAQIDVDAVPVLDGTRELLADGVVPGGSLRNLEHVRASVDVGAHDDATALLLADAQTSGGLLFGAADAGAAEEAVRSLTATGHTAAVVGRVTAGEPGTITLR
jgi:selenide,water dikinase